MKIPSRIYTYIFEHSDNMIIIADADLNILDCNQEFSKVFGKSDEDLRKLSIKDVFPSDIYSQICDWIQTSQVQQENCKRAELVNHNNEVIHVCYKLLGLESEGQKFYQIRFKDVSSQKKMETDLSTTEEHFKVLFEQNIVGVSEIDLKKGRFININEKFCSILGYTKQEMLALHYQSITHPDDLPRNLELTQQTLEGTSTGFTYEKRYMTKSDKFIWVSLTVTSVPVPGNKRRRFYAIIHDISDLKKAQEEVKIYQDRMQILQEVGLVSNWEYYLDSDMVWTTESGFALIGYKHPTGEMDVSKILATVPHVENIHKALEKFIAGKGNFQIEMVINPADGSSQRTLTASGELVKDKDGIPVKIKGVTHDITDIRKIQKELQETQNQNLVLADLINRSSQPMVVAYFDGSIGIHNQALLDLLGYQESDVPSLNYMSPNVTPPEWFDIRKKSLDKLIQTNKSVRYEIEYYRKNGSRVPVEIFADIVKDENHNPKYFYAFITDITERKAAHQALVNSVTSFHNLFEQIDIGAAFVKCMRNENGEPVDYRIVHSNIAFEIYTGFKVGDDIDPLNRELTEDNEPLCWHYYKQVFNSHVSVKFETSVPVLDRFFLVRAYPTEADSDTLITFVKDITDVKWVDTRNRE